MNEGIRGNILGVLRSMYSKLKSCVLTPQGINQSFNCTVGTRQGCKIRLVLFILYLNEFYKMCEMSSSTGVYISETVLSIVHLQLLFADGMVICGGMVGNVQRILNVLEFFCNNWGLKVSLDNTNVMVFRNGGIVRNNEKLWFMGTQLKPCTYYKYLSLNL